VFSPVNESTAQRMVAARDTAARILDVDPADDAVAWGWWGRSIGCLVEAKSGPAWLRVRSVPRGDGWGRIWEGNAAAVRALPDTVRRPKLFTWHDFGIEEYDYRAEVSEYITSQTCADDQFLREELDLPDEWWSSLRESLRALSLVDAQDRTVVSQRYITRALPHYLEAPELPTTPPRWTTAHGDLHWANLTRLGPVLLDWETWGTAPAGYDAAQLAAFTVFAPRTQQRLRRELSEFLDTPEGRFGELVVLSELLHMTTRGEHVEAANALRERARELVEAL